MRDDKERNLLAVMIFSTFLIYIKALHLSYIKMERQSLALCSGMIYGGLLPKKHMLNHFHLLGTGTSHLRKVGKAKHFRTLLRTPPSP